MNIPKDKGNNLIDKLNINSKIRDYSVTFIKDFTSVLNSSLTDATFLIIDKNVFKLYGKKLAFAASKCRHLIVEATEENKKINKIEELIYNLIELNIKKDCQLIAIGGGIIQDISGFIASVLFRGIDWEFYPTTLLAQSDSCIGSKTSVNIKEYKNQLGTFYPPAKIIVDVEFLKTLTPNAIKCGLGEIIKVFLLKDEKAFSYMKSIYHPSIYGDWKRMSQLIQQSLEIKKAFIERDEFDKDYRNLLNYGHTFGHAIESLTSYAIAHGQAVTIGMDFANYLSMRLEYLSDRDYHSMRELLVKNFPDFDLSPIQMERLVALLSKDKKNIGKKFQFILTRGAGKMFKENLIIDEYILEIFRDYAKYSKKNRIKEGTKDNTLSEEHKLKEGIINA